MATVNHSRGARLSRRFGGDRPRTHPKSVGSPANRASLAVLPAGSPLLAVLSDVRLRLEVAHAAAAVCARQYKLRPQATVMKLAHLSISSATVHKALRELSLTTRVPTAVYLREAIADLLGKYGVKVPKGKKP